VIHSHCAACATLSPERDRAEVAYAEAIEQLNASETTAPPEYVRLRAAADEARLDLTVAQIELHYHSCATAQRLRAQPYRDAPKRR
jgi:hypothetical protein